MREHTVVVGYGTKGRSAVTALLGQGLRKESIVVVDPQRKAIDQAGRDGLTAVLGDATRSDTLMRAELPRAEKVVIADVVVTSSSSAGRLLGMSILSPHAGAVMEDLLTVGSGLDLVERPVTRAEAGRSPRECADLVVSVVRGRRLLNFTDPEAAVLQLTDRIITVRRGVNLG